MSPSARLGCRGEGLARYDRCDSQFASTSARILSSCHAHSVLPRTFTGYWSRDAASRVSDVKGIAIRALLGKLPGTL